MTRLSRLFFLIVPFIFFSNDAKAQCPLGATQSTIFFGNGLDKALQDSKFVATALNDEVRPRLTDLQNSCLRDFEVAYNHDEPGWTDWLEAYVQTVSSDTARFWRMIARLEKLPDVLQKRFSEIASFLDSFEYVTVSDLNKQVDRYRQEIDTGHKVIVVSHSQGNFYANRSYELLFDPANPLPANLFEIVSVSNPDLYVGGDKPYTTLYGDFILIIPGRRDANTEVDNAVNAQYRCNKNGQLPGDNAFGCHDFIGSYLADQYSREKILSQIVNAIPVTQPPALGIHQVTNTQAGSFQGLPVGVSQDGSRIALFKGSVNSIGGGQIWSINTDGSNYVRISPPSLNVVEANFSGAGGTFIACDSPCGWSNLGTPGDIYAINYDGTGLTRLTRDGSSSIHITYSSARISDDGSKVIYLRDTHFFGSPSEIKWFLSGIDGSAIEISLPSQILDSPSISSDGSKLGLAYASNTTTKVGILNVGQGIVQELFDTGGDFGLRVNISGDSRILSFTSSLLSSNSKISIIRTDGSSIPQILDSSLSGIIGYPSINSDGSTICYTRRNSSFSVQDIFCHDSNGNKLINITDIPTLDSSADYPIVSSDGHVVVFRSNADLDSGKNLDFGQEIFVAVLK